MAVANAVCPCLWTVPQLGSRRFHINPRRLKSWSKLDRFDLVTKLNKSWAQKNWKWYEQWLEQWTLLWWKSLKLNNQMHWQTSCLKATPFVFVYSRVGCIFALMHQCINEHFRTKKVQWVACWIWCEGAHWAKMSTWEIGCVQIGMFIIGNKQRPILTW